MGRASYALSAVLLVACAATHEVDAVDAATEASAVDSALIDSSSRGGDAGADVLLAWGFPVDWALTPPVATADEDVCIGGLRSGDAFALLADVGFGEPFVVCVDEHGITRSRVWTCPSGPREAPRVATDGRGALFAAGHFCGSELDVLRLASDLSTAAMAPVPPTTSGVLPGILGMEADGSFLVLGGGVNGPWLIVLDANDLHLLRSIEGDGHVATDGEIRALAIHAGTLLAFGRDATATFPTVAGTESPDGAAFAVTLSLPDGVPMPLVDHPWFNIFDAEWAPDGMPLLLGTFGGMTLAHGPDAIRLDTGGLDAPELAVGGTHVVIARGFEGTMTLGASTLTTPSLAGFLASLDDTTFQPTRATLLVAGYNIYDIDTTAAGLVGVVGWEPPDRTVVGPSLALYRAP